MIQPLMSNASISFGNKQANTQTTAQPAQQATAQEQQPKESFFKRVKTGFLSVAKSFNTVTGVGSGAARGLMEGGIATAAVALVGKNCKQGKGQILATAGGILKDLGHGVTTVVKHIPDVITKAPIENVKNIFNTAVKSTSKLAKGIKNNKLASAAAIATGIVIFAARLIQGKAKANRTNAELDHITNHGHQG